MQSQKAQDSVQWSGRRFWIIFQVGDASPIPGGVGEQAGRGGKRRAGGGFRQAPDAEWAAEPDLAADLTRFREDELAHRELALAEGAREAPAYERGTR